MDIYFANREFNDPMYKNQDYLNQQAQFISVLRMKTNNFSIRGGELHLEKNGVIYKEVGYLHIELRNVKSVTVCIPKLGINYSLHELFRIWNKNRDADKYELPGGFLSDNLVDFLGNCHDILTVKFQDEWKLAS